MIRKFILIALGGTAGAACEPETIRGGQQADPMRDELAKAAPVELPPAISASKTYRCKDNSLVRIDWLQGGRGANLRVGDDAAVTQLRTPEPTAEGGNEASPVAEGFVAEGGYVLRGDAVAATINLAMPGKPAQSCRA